MKVRMKVKMKEKMISSPTIKISDAKVALADIEIEKILLFNQKEKIKPVGEVEQISFYLLFFLFFLLKTHILFL